MYIEKKITVSGVLQEGVEIGIKNAASLVVAVILWLITFWIPYLNVGTTIALSTIPIELSKGKIISPTFIFDAKYRKYMGEYFTLIGLMSMAIFPAACFMIVPGLIIYIGWSLAIYIMLDKGIAPSEAMIRSNHSTYGYKWTIFLVQLAIMVIFFVALFILGLIPFIGPLLIFVLIVCLMPISLGCMSVIYKNLTREASSTPIEETVTEEPVAEEPIQE